MSGVSAADNITDNNITQSNSDYLTEGPYDDIDYESTVYSYEYGDRIIADDISDIEINIDSPHNGTLKAYIDNELISKINFNPQDKVKIYSPVINQSKEYDLCLKFDFSDGEYMDFDVFQLNSKLYFTFNNPTSSNYNYKFFFQTIIDNKDEIEIDMNHYFYQILENTNDIKIVIDSPYEGILETYLNNDLINKRNFNTNDEFRLSSLKDAHTRYNLLSFKLDFSKKDLLMDYEVQIINSTFYFKFFNETQTPLKTYKYVYSSYMCFEPQETIKIGSVVSVWGFLS